MQEALIIFYVEVGVQVQADPNDSGLAEGIGASGWPCHSSSEGHPALGSNLSCLWGRIYGSASRPTSLLVRQHQFPENCTWLWLKYQECDSVSGICCLHAALQLCFYGR